MANCSCISAVTEDNKQRLALLHHPGKRGVTLDVERILAVTLSEKRFDLRIDVACS